MSDPSVDLSKSPDRPAILGQFSVVNRCLPADNKVILNALMSTNQRQTEKKPVFWWLDNDRRLVDGLFNDCFNRRNRPSSKKMLLLGPTDTKLVSRRKSRSKSAKTTADELPTVARRIPFLLETSRPLVVIFFNVTEVWVRNISFAFTRTVLVNINAMQLSRQSWNKKNNNLLYIG